jgi:hypothetical protein
VRPWVELEQVRYARCLELVVQALVLGAEARIPFSYIEGEERRVPSERTP